MTWPFQIYGTYHRRNDIHKLYKGQQQSGISTPTNCPGIFIFTGNGANRAGYQDVFQKDGRLRYTGQGQTGDMKMIAGNKAIRDHVKNSKDLLLFQQTCRTGIVRFKGLFICAGWDCEIQKDAQGNLRKAIVFTLIPQDYVSKKVKSLTIQAPDQTPLHTLREKAFKAVAVPELKSKHTPGTVFSRSKAIRDYILARAEGKCEHCQRPAPFLTVQGYPYLEAHHILRLTDGGPDHPKSIIALCPNCHREAHFGNQQELLKNKFLGIVSVLEQNLGHLRFND
ncbi:MULTISPECIES: HNH endonuclease signature motif containing protein [unclassified Saccharibacter]|uniref:HNH endonuclease n=1 Tax=unclassified Saccharibacter TaxID=2648722 RepID=UPI00132B1555|nr:MULTISPECIES: HNH endonuclease signature motif containing protein [unclassified Saccharibacter]MXV35138.1 HNH endonuclease [Saccharibacter sp. EH611]MXV57315.1 HNH endonuclease [Saccharibacter sp. EH70]MXV64824.1 HNH endonuclease [Saccharibacter sp. EH60]